MRGVYTVIRDMDAAKRFCRAALGLAPSFRTDSRWCQFRLGGTSLALGSAGETARRVQGAGGALLGRRDINSHGAVLSYADPEGNLSQIFSRSAA